MCECVCTGACACSLTYPASKDERNGVGKELLNNISALQDNILDYKGDIDGLISVLHTIKNRQIAEAIVSTINKFSSEYVQRRKNLHLRLSGRTLSPEEQLISVILKN